MCARLVNIMRGPSLAAAGLRRWRDRPLPYRPYNRRDSPLKRRGPARAPPGQSIVSELRRDPILRRWVIIAPERGVEVLARRASPPPGKHVGPCPFCPGNESMNPEEIAAVREDGAWLVRVTPDKQPLLRIEGDLERRGAGMFDKMNAIGAHELVSDTPEHARPWADFGTLPDRARLPLAELMVGALGRLRATVGDPPYSVALHAGPLDGSDEAEFHWHWEIAPHLGHELGMEWATGIFSNPVPPEEA